MSEQVLALALAVAQGLVLEQLLVLARQVLELVLVQVPELNDCSIVSASYRVGDHSNGTLGIIGPTRMNYNRVISVLDFMGRALSDVLSEYR